MTRTIIIGAGHNGLASATLLAKAGHNVTVLEARSEAGGLCAPCRFGDDEYEVPGLLHDTRGLRPALVDTLGLRGLKRIKSPRIYLPSEADEGMWLDEANTKDFDAFIQRVKPVVTAMMDHPPPDPLGAVWPLLMTGFKVRRLGADDMLELIRISAMCVADWMRDTFDDERLCAAVALPALEASFLGPWSAGSAALLLIREAMAETPVKGGPAAVAAALVKAASSAGATIRCDARVKAIRIKGRQVEGVTLADDETLDADVVLSTVDPKQTFLKLVGVYRIPDDLACDIRNVRTRGTTAKVHLAIDGALEVDGNEVESMRTGDTLDAIEKAFDAAKYRRFSERPTLDVRVPSQGIVSIMAHYAPYDLDGGWNEDQRTALGDAVIDELARYAPTIKDQIKAREVLTPADIEARYGTTHGHLYHGEHAPDQLLHMRPSVDCGSYATPINGLWLGGSGSHPGGGVTCAPGALAARAILS